MTANQFIVLVLTVLLSACAGCRSGRARLTIADLKRVSAHSANPSGDFRIRGVVTYVEGRSNTCVIEDGTGGLPVHLANGISQLGEGFEVEAAVHPSTSDPGAFETARLSILGRRTPPPVKQVSLAGTALAAHLYSRIAIRGVIQAIVESKSSRRLGYVYIRSEDGSLRAGTLLLGLYEIEQYIDSDISVEGVLMPQPGGSTDGRYELWVSSLADFRRLKVPVPASEAPVEAVGDLLRTRFQPSPHRIGVRGRIIFANRGRLTLSEGLDVIDVDLAPGFVEPTIDSDVEIAGFLDVIDGHPKLKYAVLTRAGGQAQDCLVAPQSCGLPLRTALKVHRFDQLSAARHYPVELNAVVTYYEPVSNLLFVQDSTDGIFVRPDMEKSDTPRLGDRVVVRGATIAGGFAPDIGYASVKVIGRAPLPQPARDTERAFLGKRDCQLVEFAGVVQEVISHDGHTSLTLVWGVHSFKVQLLAPIEKARLLLDRTVRVRGVAGALTNNARQILGVQLFAADLSMVRVETGRSRDAFSLAVRPAATLLQFSKDSDFGHRVHLQGVVTFPSESGPTWIRDATGGVKIDNHEKAALAAGDIVDVVGFPRQGGFGPVLAGASLNRLRTGTPAAPWRISAQEAAKGTFESQLVQLDSILVDQSLKDGFGELTLRSGSTIFSARLAEAKLAEIRPGAVCRVTGIRSVIVDNSLDEIKPQGFRILLRSRDDVQVLSAAPWLTSGRLAAILSATFLLALAALVWVAMLRRLVRLQTRKLSGALSRARDAESLEQDREALLELVARNEPLDRILSEFARVIEGRSAGAVCSIQVQLPDHPRVVVSSSLSPAFAAEMESLDLTSERLSAEFGKVELLSSAPSSIESHGFSYFSAVPIASGARAIGAILVFFPSEPPSNPYERDILLSWGALASLAVERSGLYERLFFRAQYDDLTGLLNRGSIYEKVDHEIANASETGDGVAILYLDLDEFKAINDAFGHDAGDEVLRTAARRIRQSVRRSDFVGRVGGDEFVILLTRLAGREEADRISSLVLSSLRSPIGVQNRDLHFSASLGLSYYPDDGDTIEQLLKAADREMYRVKRSHAAQTPDHAGPVVEKR